jgi:hypothetical protein
MTQKTLDPNYFLHNPGLTLRLLCDSPIHLSISGAVSYLTPPRFSFTNLRPRCSLLQTTTCNRPKQTLHKHIVIPKMASATPVERDQVTAPSSVALTTATGCDSCTQRRIKHVRFSSYVEYNYPQVYSCDCDQSELRRKWWLLGFLGAVFTAGIWGWWIGITGRKGHS